MEAVWVHVGATALEAAQHLPRVLEKRERLERGMGTPLRSVLVMAPA